MVTVNQDQQLYVIPVGKYFSCLGFDVVLTSSKRIGNWLKIRGIEVSIPTERGTMETYEQYNAILSKAHDYCLENKTRCDIDLVPELEGLEGKRVEVKDKYGDTRRFQVGKSTGWLPCHLELARRDSTGGTQVYGNPFVSVRVIN